MRVADRVLAIPVEHVIETMRPLPILASRSRIRGAPCPVIDLASRLGLRDPAPPRRFVIVRGAHGPVALQVAAVLDLRALGDGERVLAPPGDDGLDAIWADARWSAPSGSDHDGSGLHGAAGAVEPHTVP